MKLKKVLADIVPVLVGILLALFINQFQQSRAEKAYIRNSVRSIILENEENIKEIEYALKRQAVFIDTLQNYLNDDEISLSEVLSRARGVYSPDLKSTTWKFLVQDSKHTLVSYEFINRLAEIEKYEVLVNRYNVKIGDIIFQPAFFDDPRLKDVFKILFGDFGNVQRNMIKELKDFNGYARETYSISKEGIESD